MVQVLEEYLFAIVFIGIAWIASVQGARLFPHGIKKGRQVGYVHFVIVGIGVIEFALPLYSETRIDSIRNDSPTQYWKLILLFGIPYHMQLWLTNFIFFIWLKIYYSVGVTDGWLRALRRMFIVLSSISFVVLIFVTILCLFLTQQLTSLLFTIGMCLIW